MKAANLKKVTFPDSGKETYLPNVSLAGQSLRVQRKYPRPQPPMQKVDYGDGRPRFEPNYAHPDYRIQLQEWQRFLELKTQDQALARLYRMKLTDAQKAEVDEWKAQHPDQFDENDSDTALWFEEIAILTENDFQQIIDVLSGVKEEEVDAIQDSFQGDTE